MIKASFEVLQPVTNQSFIVREFGNIAFDAPYHFHPEFELTLIIRGSGKRYVGNHMEDFSAGDLVLLGPNLPHCWKIENDEASTETASAVVIQFNADFLGADFFNKPEVTNIRKLFHRSECGICFKGEIQQTVGRDLMRIAAEANNFKTLIGFLEALQNLSATSSYKLLDQQRSTGSQSIADQERINPVFAYLVDNFRTHVSLDKAAGIANMTPNAFCKYFKKITRKTFMETVIEYRLNYATQQLVQTDKPISEISFDSGFGDVSHFFKMFKKKMQLSPLNYRKRFMSNIDDIIQAGV